MYTTIIQLTNIYTNPEQLQSLVSFDNGENSQFTKAYVYPVGQPNDLLTQIQVDVDKYNAADETVTCLKVEE